MKIFTTFLILVLMIVASLGVSSQTIKTNSPVGDAFCPGTPIEVSFETTGTFQADNKFTLQISGPDGSFNSFRNFGYLASATSGKITADLPNDLASGKKYRLRVISTKPYVVGQDNGSNIEIFTHLESNHYYWRDKFFFWNGEKVTFHTDFDSSSKYNSAYSQPLNWDFGPDATPRYYTGIYPPPVKFAQPGMKEINYRVDPADNCSFKLDKTDLFYTFDCSLKIDSNAISPKDPYNFKGLRQSWIMPGDVVKSDDGIGPAIVILENGASLEINGYCMTVAFYLKPGASVFSKYGYEQCAIVRSPGSSINYNQNDTNNKYKSNTYIECDSIMLDYKSAPQSGKDILVSMGLLGINDDDNISGLSIMPNPAGRQFSVRYYLDNPGNVKISLVSILGSEYILVNEYQAAGEYSIRHELNIDFPDGVYFLRLQSGNDIKYEKMLVVSDTK